MNLNLNYEGFEDYLIVESYHPSTHGGVHYMFRFENGLGASVLKSHRSYGCEKDLWELRVVKYWDRENSIQFDLIYDTPITNCVVGYCTDEEIRELLRRIKDL